jgi:hypothetical protein
MHPNQKADLRELQDHGVEADSQNKVCPNVGSESFRHLLAKSVVAHIALNNGYRVDSEVNIKGNQMDLLLWGNRERLTLCVEVETSPTEEVKQSKLEQYVKGVPAIDDMYLLNLNEMPESRLEVLEWASDQLGLDP